MADGIAWGKAQRVRVTAQRAVRQALLSAPLHTVRRAPRASPRVVRFTSCAHAEIAWEGRGAHSVQSEAEEPCNKFVYCIQYSIRYLTRYSGVEWVGTSSGLTIGVGNNHGQ